MQARQTVARDQAAALRIYRRSLGCIPLLTVVLYVLAFLARGR